MEQFQNTKTVFGMNMKRAKTIPMVYSQFNLSTERELYGLEELMLKIWCNCYRLCSKMNIFFDFFLKNLFLYSMPNQGVFFSSKKEMDVLFAILGFLKWLCISSGNYAVPPSRLLSNRLQDIVASFQKDLQCIFIFMLRNQGREPL